MKYMYSNYIVQWIESKAAVSIVFFNRDHSSLACPAMQTSSVWQYNQ